MVEEIKTGGLKKFVVGKTSKIDKELARKIDEAYEKAEIRKAREKRNKVILIIIIILVILAGLSFFLLR